MSAPERTPMTLPLQTRRISYKHIRCQQELKSQPVLEAALSLKAVLHHSHVGRGMKNEPCNNHSCCTPSHLVLQPVSQANDDTPPEQYRDVVSEYSNIFQDSETLPARRAVNDLGIVSHGYTVEFAKVRDSKTGQLPSYPNPPNPSAQSNKADNLPAPRPRKQGCCIIL